MERNHQNNRACLCIDVLADLKAYLFSTPAQTTDPAAVEPVRANERGDVEADWQRSELVRRAPAATHSRVPGLRSLDARPLLSPGAATLASSSGPARLASSSAATQVEHKLTRSPRRGPYNTQIDTADVVETPEQTPEPTQAFSGVTSDALQEDGGENTSRPLTSIVLRHAPKIWRTTDMVSYLGRRGLGGTFDFVHVPARVGIGIVNFKQSSDAERFKAHINEYGLQDNKLRSQCRVTAVDAEYQGFDNQIHRFQELSESGLHQDNKHQPYVFSQDYPDGVSLSVWLRPNVQRGSGRRNTTTSSASSSSGARGAPTASVCWRKSQEETQC